MFPDEFNHILVTKKDYDCFVFLYLLSYYFYLPLLFLSHGFKT